MPQEAAKTDQDYDAVQQLILRAIEIIRSDDFDQYFNLFTDDAVWMMPSSYDDVYKEEARSFYRFTRKFRFDQQVAIKELFVDQDVAYARISFDGYLKARFDPDAPPVRSVSRHLWILERQPDRGWKISRDIWNNPKLPARRAGSKV
ncbi:MAG: hypothetical protein CMQ05_12480 [Gammaproteobacteria bacterium]|nr:hypothetical protein [Gammaproteobacteria bacterium]RPG25187.1 MAG: hypothetical protein CBC10_008720 [Gammaproteobacteria bacterium TMED50]|tara:strand:- start:251 stop:691 length:441 start_codon:yes stop_codon:yes gene_type:complete